MRIVVVAVTGLVAGLMMVSGAGAQERSVGTALGPTTLPVPQWFWEWARWRLGHGVYYCEAGQRRLRPPVPEVVPSWMWMRLKERHVPRPCIRTIPGFPPERPPDTGSPVDAPSVPLPAD